MSAILFDSELGWGKGGLPQGISEAVENNWRHLNYLRQSPFCWGKQDPVGEFKGSPVEPGKHRGILKAMTNSWGSKSLPQTVLHSGKP